VMQYILQKYDYHRLYIIYSVSDEDNTILHFGIFCVISFLSLSYLSDHDNLFELRTMRTTTIAIMSSTRARIRTDGKAPRLLPLASAKITALHILLSLIWMSSVTKTAIVEAVDAASNVGGIVDNSRRSLRRNLLLNNDNIGFGGQQQGRRSLQAYTNETVGYEDGAAVNQDRQVDFEYCYGALQRADTNNDGRLETVDYLSFVQDFGSNTECLGNLMSSPVMPIELTACWNQLSCECRARGGAPDCCEKENAHLPLGGLNAVGPAPSGQTQPQPPQGPFIDQEQNFLKQTCLRTDQCIISYCGYPPPPILILPPIVPPTIPPTIPPVPKEAAVNEPNLWWLLFLILLLCCCCRRWILCAAGKLDDDDEDLEQATPVEQDTPVPVITSNLPGENGIEIGLPTDIENSPDDFGGDYDDPDANRTTMMSMAASELGEGGGVRYYRVVQEPEYEEPPPPPEPKVIDQYDKGLPEGDDMKLNHVEKLLPPPPKEDPYALEHYEPDGGLVEHERTGEWSYEADGGYNVEERTAKKDPEWNRPGYDRAAVVAAVPINDLRDRNLDKYGGGAIFDHLDETDEPPKKGDSGNLLQWVFTKTLNTLDDNQDDLRSETSASKGSL